MSRRPFRTGTIAPLKFTTPTTTGGAVGTGVIAPRVKISRTQRSSIAYRVSAIATIHTLFIVAPVARYAGLATGRSPNSLRPALPAAGPQALGSRVASPLRGARPASLSRSYGHGHDPPPDQLDAEQTVEHLRDVERAHPRLADDLFHRVLA